MKAAIEYDTAEQESWVPQIADLIASYGYEVNLVSTEDIMYGELLTGGYDFVTFPGGLGAFDGLRKYGDKFGQAIRYYVASGGGFLGMCGGAYVAGIDVGTPLRDYCAYVLGLVDIGTRLDPKMMGFFFDYYTTAQGQPTLVECKMAASSHPIIDGYNGELVTMAFTGGPRLVNPGISVTPLATFESGVYSPGELAATASVFGKGRVVICSPHPEWVHNNEILLEWFYRNMVTWVSEPAPVAEWPLLPWEIKKQVTIPWTPIAIGALALCGAALYRVTRRSW